MAPSKVGPGRALHGVGGGIGRRRAFVCELQGLVSDVYFYDLMIANNEHNEVAMRLTNMSRGPGNVVGRCLKPLSASAKLGEHSLAVVERPAHFVYL